MLVFRSYLSQTRSRILAILMVLVMALCVRSPSMAQSSVICTYEPDSVWKHSGLMKSEEEAVNQYSQILEAKVNTRTNCFPYRNDSLLRSLSGAEMAELERLELEKAQLLNRFEELVMDFATKAHQESVDRIGNAAESAGKQCGCMAAWPKSMVLYGPVYDISKEVMVKLKADTSRLRE